MDDKITKKTVIYITILILLIGGYLTYLILQNTVFNENIKELNYYYEIENEDSISDILNKNQTIAFKNDIQKYLEELEYKENSIFKIKNVNLYGMETLIIKITNQTKKEKRICIL